MYFISYFTYRYALASAVAASGVPALVLSKGHAIDQVPEIPLVVSDKVQELTKTKQAVIFLRRLKAWADIQKVFVFFVSLQCFIILCDDMMILFWSVFLNTHDFISKH